MAYQSGRDPRTDPYRADPTLHPGARPHELGRGGASARAGWVAAIIVLVLLGAIVLAGMAGDEPVGVDAPAAVPAPAADPAANPATDPAASPPAQPGTDLAPAAPAPAPATDPAPAPAPVE